MKLRFLGKESTPTNSPTLYSTDRDTYIVQGWIVSDVPVLGLLDIGPDETVVEVPASLMAHLAADGLDGSVTNLVPPIVHVLDSGNYIVQGPRVRDAEALGQMTIPDHEDCIEIAKSDMRALLVGA